ncbi:MAG: hypothetical protein M3Z25_01680 [Actinomycetota bacterium]|nr:hypothetical protein [Actinomycetota bacterium]
MTSDNPTADRLLSDARKKTAALESPMLAYIGIALAAIGLIVGATVIPLVGWVLGAAAVALGGVSLKRDVAVKLARIALLIGVVAILATTFNVTWVYANGYWWYESF